jgi:hypothetical protein
MMTQAREGIQIKTWRNKSATLKCQQNRWKKEKQCGFKKINNMKESARKLRFERKTK